MIDYTRNGDGTGTLTLSFTNEEANMESFIADLSEALWGQADGYENLSNQDKLDLIERRVRAIMTSDVRGLRQERAARNVQVDF